MMMTMTIYPMMIIIYQHIYTCLWGVQDVARKYTVPSHSRQPPTHCSHNMDRHGQWHTCLTVWCALLTCVHISLTHTFLHWSKALNVTLSATHHRTWDAVKQWNKPTLVSSKNHLYNNTMLLYLSTFRKYWALLQLLPRLHCIGHAHPLRSVCPACPYKSEVTKSAVRAVSNFKTSWAWRSTISFSCIYILFCVILGDFFFGWYPF